MPEVIFSGSVGRIEAFIQNGQYVNSPVVLILHPDPQKGGTMNNKIVNVLFRSFIDFGFTALKFNYRGVGRSEGVHDDGEGELSDAASALDWIQSQFPQVNNFWVAGYSFGAYLGMQLLMRRPELEGFISVSPPANKFDFNFLAPCPVSGQIIQGDADTYVKHQSVNDLVIKLRNQRGISIDYNLIKGANHLYSEKQHELESLIKGYLEKRMGSFPDRLAS